MVEFSISAVVDALIQLAAFLLVCTALYFFLKVITRSTFETNFFRTIAVVAVFVMGRVYLTNNVEWASGIAVQVSLLGGIVFLLVLALLKPPVLVAPIAAAALIMMGFSAEKGAALLSAKLAPEGPTFAEYMGAAQHAIKDNKNQDNLKSTDVDVVDVMRKGLDALATLTQEDEVEAMKSDFNRGISLFAERKAWMDSLTPEEKIAYREELAAFLAEQGIAQDRYSLAAIKDVNPTNLVALADLFNELQDDGVDEETKIRSIPESIAQITANLGSFNLDEDDTAMLQRFAELFGKNDMRQAIDRARKDLEAVKGDDEFLGTVLAAMVQAESDLPMDQMLAADGESSFDVKSLKVLASNHWKRMGKNPETEWMTIGTTETIRAVEVSEPVPSPDPFIRVTTRFGVAFVPHHDENIRSWIEIAQGMEFKGYISLGDEVVILRTDGTMLRKGEDWGVESGGHVYRFKIEDIRKGRVTMRATVRENIGNDTPF